MARKYFGTDGIRGTTNVYFDTDKWNLTPDAAHALDEAVPHRKIGSLAFARPHVQRLTARMGGGLSVQVEVAHNGGSQNPVHHHRKQHDEACHGP